MSLLQYHILAQSSTCTTSSISLVSTCLHTGATSPLSLRTHIDTFMHMCYISCMFGFSHGMLLFPMLCDCSHRGDQSTIRKHVTVMFVHLQYYQFILYRMAVPMEIHGQSTARNYSVALLPRLSVSNAPACTISLGSAILSHTHLCMCATSTLSPIL